MGTTIAKKPELQAKVTMSSCLNHSQPHRVLTAFCLVEKE